jgi:sigma-E factor negative regulatory protein RseB
MRWQGLGLVLALAAAPVWAASSLPAGEASAWLQRMADASRQLAYEGTFILAQGDRMQSLQIVNQPAGQAKDSRLVMLDGQQREVRCTRNASVSVEGTGPGLRRERRLGSRHFPDLLPENTANLVEWYAVRLGELARVGGLDCRQVELVPKDRYRWGYVLCADSKTYLPLKAVMVNEAGQPLMYYSFAEVRIGPLARPLTASVAPAPSAEEARPAQADVIQVRQLPPGFTRVLAMKRRLPRHAAEVEHWVYSDGLTHVSLFIEPAVKPVASLKGASPRGMMNLLTRQVGDYQVTVVGDAPWPAVEAIAMNLARP